MVERVPPLRIKVGNKRSPSPWIYVIILLLFMGIGLVLFLHSPLSRMEKIQIDGNRLVTDDRILKTLQLNREVSFFHVKVDHAEKTLEKFPEIKHVDIKKVFPNRLHITVQEYPIIAYTQWEDGQYAPVLWTGTIFSEHRTSDIIDGWPIIDRKAQTNRTVLLSLQNLLQVPDQIRREIKFVYPVPNHPDQVKLSTSHHHQIYVRAQELHQKLIYYPTFKKHPPGTLYLLQSIWFRPE